MLEAFVQAIEPSKDSFGKPDDSSFRIIAVVTDGQVKSLRDLPSVASLENLKSTLRSTVLSVEEAQSTLATLKPGDVIDLSEAPPDPIIQARIDYINLQAKLYNAQRQIAAQIISSDNADYLSLLGQVQKAYKTEYLGL